MIKLSVIIPCFNNGNYLKEMMDCCLKQTFKDWELIVVDDQSTDEVTPQIVRDYAEKDNRIKFFVRNREPKGSVVCRNIGFEHSSGEYVIHFDADDLISDTCFEKRVQFMDENPDCDYASFPAKCFNDGEALPLWDGKADYGVSLGDKELLFYFLSTNYPFSVWCNIYRRESIKNLLWDENVKIYTDFSYIVPCILSGLRHKFSELTDYDYFYRKFVKNNENSNNMCSNFISRDKCTSTIYLFNKVFKAISAREDKQFLLRSFSRFVQLHFERLLQTNNSETIDEFINTISPYYPDLLKSFIAIKKKVINRINGHFNQAMIHYLLYKHFGNRYNRVMCVHEIGKWILCRP